MTQAPLLVVVVKGYPRLSETFIAQEFLGLEKRGLRLHLISLRQPTDPARHPIHDEISANINYIPEYLYLESRRVWRSFWACRSRPGLRRALALFLRDLARDPTPNRVRRLGQALVMVAEMPQGAVWLHAHFAHSPASVARYAAAIMGQGYSFSAHAKDIWTSADWDLAGKLGEADWAVTCTAAGQARLAGLATRTPVHLSYHGLDLKRFPPMPDPRPLRDGANPDDPARLLSVGRAVPKKGFDLLLDALARLPVSLNWRLVHIGGGAELVRLQAQATRLGLAHRIEWRGALAQTDVLRAYREADCFILASRRTKDGDRDGLPNVIVEAASQSLGCVSTALSGIPEFIRDDETGLLVPPENVPALTGAVARMIAEPLLRARLGAAAMQLVHRDFDHERGIRQLEALFRNSWGS